MNFQDNLNVLLDKAKQMQSKMQDVQKELTNFKVTGEAGAGLVKVTMNGRHDVLKVSIDDSLINPEERDMLEDLIAAAINDASLKIENLSKEKISNLTSELDFSAGLVDEDDKA